MRSLFRPRHAGRAMPPGPRGYPFLGMLPQLSRDPLGAFAAAARDYGDLVRLPAGPYRIYLLNHPDHVRRVLQDNHRNYRRTRLNEKLKLLLGDGLVTSDGALWRRQRRLIQPAFQPSILQAFAPVMTAAAEAMLDRWQTRTAPLDIAKEMMRLTLDIVTRAMFGTAIEAEAEAIGRALGIAQDYAMRRLLALTDLGERLPTRRNREFRQARRVLDEIVHRILRQHQAGRAAPANLLSLLADARDPQTGEAMAEGQVRDEVMTMLLAGHETTANALAWTWHLLARNPAAEDSLAREVADLLGDRTPRAEDMPALAYTRMVIQEAMRLYPPVWRIGRSPIVDDVIGGYRIPAGSIVILCQYLMHRHPAFWDRPESFEPERFAPDRAAGRPRYAYFPFAGGPHACIGAQFAMMEMQLVIPMILQRFRLRALPGHPVEMAPLITLRARRGLMMRLEPRRPQQRA